VSGQKTRILVIDDEFVIRSFLQEILAFSGYEADTAATAKDGLALFGQNSYDLVVSDLGLPEISGWEVAKAVKSVKPRVPFILLSGWGIELEDVRIQECGIDLVLSKPCQMDEILNAVGRFLNRGSPEALP
jgi:DNA-binding response OmpR family regulator